MRAIFAGLLGLSLLAGAAHAADIPAPPAPMVGIFAGKDSTTKAPFADQVMLGSFKITIEETVLADLQATLGGNVRRMGGGGDTLHWLCYDLPGARLWLWSSAIGGGSVDGVTAQVRGGADNRCPALPAKYATIKVNGKLALGISQADLVNWLGAPKRQAGPWLGFARSVDLPNDYTEDTTLAVRIEGGKVTYFEVHKNTVN